jgi:hypothetical protein
MCLLITTFLGLLVAVLVWLAVGLQKTVDVKTEDVRQLRHQLRICNDQRIKDSIAEKSGAWRRDRRIGDNPRGGNTVKYAK